MKKLGDQMKDSSENVVKYNQIMFISVAYNKCGYLDGIVVDIKSFTQRIKDLSSMFKTIFYEGSRFYT